MVMVVMHPIRPIRHVLHQINTAFAHGLAGRRGIKFIGQLQAQDHFFDALPVLSGSGLQR